MISEKRIEKELYGEKFDVKSIKTNAENNFKDKFEELHENGHMVYASTKSEDLMNLSNEDLCELYQQGINEAMDILCTRKANLIHKTARRIMKEYRPESLTEDDLYIEGNIALMTAAKKYDRSMGYYFSSYASRLIDQTITREVMNNGYTIRIPVNVFEQIIVVNNCRKSKCGYTLAGIQHVLSSKFNKDYTLDDVRTLIGYADKLMKGSSLNEVICSENSETELGELIADETSFEDDVIDLLTGELIEEVIDNKLSDKECDVLRLRFGLGGCNEHALEEVGKKYGETRERIRQIEAKAIRKLSRKNNKLAGLLVA